jgi:dihydrofolate synthase / folylpolyglutamate synthase
MSSTDYQSALAYIHSFDDPYQAAIRDHGKQTWGLAKISELLTRLGNPHLAYPTVHVAGTKGKGSTAAMIAQGLMESGLKTGLYTSPHLDDWRERIQINRNLIPTDELAHVVDAFKPAVDESAHISEFEVATALAFLYFRQQNCDIAVIEVGLGGRLDATNVVTPLVSVITNISLDHMQLLGDTIAEIAAEKAAIIKPGIPVVSAPQLPDARRVIEQKAAAMHSLLIQTDRSWTVIPGRQSMQGSQFSAGDGQRLESYDLTLPGRFQIENAVVALAALAEVSRAGLEVPLTAVRKGLANIVWPGRLETVSGRPLCVIDSAHTPYSVEQLVLALREVTGRSGFTVVFGCMADKDIDGMLRQLLPVTGHLIFTHARNDRAASVELLDSRARSVGVLSEIITREPSIEKAIDIARGIASPDGIICVTGSLSVVGEARSAILDSRTAAEPAAKFTLPQPRAG